MIQKRRSLLRSPASPSGVDVPYIFFFFCTPTARFSLSLLSKSCSPARDTVSEVIHTGRSRQIPSATAHSLSARLSPTSKHLKWGRKDDDERRRGHRQPDGVEPTHRPHGRVGHSERDVFVFLKSCPVIEIRRRMRKSLHYPFILAYRHKLIAEMQITQGQLMSLWRPIMCRTNQMFPPPPRSDPTFTSESSGSSINNNNNKNSGHHAKSDSSTPSSAALATNSESISFPLYSPIAEMSLSVYFGISRATCNKKKKKRL